MKFSELLKKDPKTELERTICAAVATVSTKPGFTKMTPDEVFDWLVASGNELFQ